MHILEMLRLLLVKPQNIQRVVADLNLLQIQVQNLLSPITLTIHELTVTFVEDETTIAVMCH